MQLQAKLPAGNAPDKRALLEGIEKITRRGAVGRKPLTQGQKAFLGVIAETAMDTGDFRSAEKIVKIEATWMRHDIREGIKAQQQMYELAAKAAKVNGILLLLLSALGAPLWTVLALIAPAAIIDCRLPFLYNSAITHLEKEAMAIEKLAGQILKRIEKGVRAGGNKQ